MARPARTAQYEERPMRKDQTEVVRKFTDRLFNAAEKILRRRIEDLSEDTMEGDGIFIGEQWSKKAEFAVKGNVTIRVIVTAMRND